MCLTTADIEHSLISCLSVCLSEIFHHQVVEGLRFTGFIRQEYRQESRMDGWKSSSLGDNSNSLSALKLQSRWSLAELAVPGEHWMEEAYELRLRKQQLLIHQSQQMRWKAQKLPLEVGCIQTLWRNTGNANVVEESACKSAVGTNLQNK